MCKLVYSLYCLKQPPKEWHENFDSVMIKNHFHINECGKCINTKQTEQEVVIVFMCLYVDDMLIIRTNMKVIKFTTKVISNSF